MIPLEVILRIKDTRSNIRHRLRKWLVTGQVKLSPFFERLRDSATDPLEDYETLWQFVSLTTKPLYEYTPKMGRTYHHECIVAVTSSYNYPVMLVSVWWSIERPVLMPKLHFLAWLAHAGGYKTNKSYTRFTNTSPICQHC
jgi:hypothetical protein